MSLCSALVDWHRDATSVPFGHLLIGLSPRTEDRLRYCKNTGSIPSNFYIPDRQRQSKILGNEHRKSFYSPNVPIAFPQMEKSLSSVLSQRVYPFSMRMHSKSTQRKFASHKKTSHVKVSRRNLATIAKKNNMEAKKERSVVTKRLTAH